MRTLSCLLAGLGAVGCGAKPAQAPPADAASTQDTALPTDAGSTADAGQDQSTAPQPFSIDALVRTRMGSENNRGWPNKGRVFADVDWKTGPFTRVTLVIDLDTSCFPWEKWNTNPPPAGQAWPSDCDAFDRNFNAYIDDGGGAQTTPFEVMHAITPFGGPEHIEVDLTDLANALPGAHRLRVDLISYSDSAGSSTGSNNGWTVSARIDVTPGEAPHRVLAAVPLYAGQVQMGDAWPTVSFQAPPGTVGGKLEYRTSGHGQGAAGDGCIGPAEEFCDRRQQIFVDGAMAEDIHPYRTDCSALCTLAHGGPLGLSLDYCVQNPGGLPDSVRASRANWCPGSMTPPYAWSDIPALANPGPHTFSFQVSQILAGGSWMVSAIYYAYGS